MLDSTTEVATGSDRLYVHASSGTATAVAIRTGDSVLISYRGRQYRVEKNRGRAAAGGIATGELRAPMPGLIIDVMVEPGQSVVKGQRLVVLEAMKTQQPFSAPFDGIVAAVEVEKGHQVTDGALLVRVKPNA